METVKLFSKEIGYFILAMFFTLFFVVLCTEEIVVKTDDAPPRVVIYGYITSDTMQHSIRITRSAGYFTTERPDGISNAEVTVTDDLGEVIIFSETEPGLYQTALNEYGIEGRTYTLDVYLDFDGKGVKEHYQSTAYLQRINHIDSIDLRHAPPPFINSVEVMLYAQDLPGQKNIYSIFVRINDSIVNPTINRFFIMDNVLFSGQYMPGVGCYYLNQNPDHEYRNEVLHIGDTVTLNINAISESYADFIGAVKSELGGSNPIFGGPPANVPTNIKHINSNDGIPPVGFFTAYPSRYSYTIVKEDFSIKK